MRASFYFGIDNVALVQECFTARDGIITRVEVLGGKYFVCDPDSYYRRDV